MGWSAPPENPTIVLRTPPAPAAGIVSIAFVGGAFPEMVTDEQFVTHNLSNTGKTGAAGKTFTISRCEVKVP